MFKHQIDSFKDALTVIQYYLWRWLIERFHFLLKSGGAQVEKLQLQTPQRLKNAITTFSIAVMDAFKLRYLAENNPHQTIYEDICYKYFAPLGQVTTCII